MKTFYLALLALGIACGAEAATPTLSISLTSPAILRFSWPSNFTDWQLESATNLRSAAWQTVTQVPFTSGNSLVVLLPITNSSGFFRLEQTNSGGACVFQATPPVINSGASSTLNWCPIAGTTYRLAPGPGIVSGSSFIVTPAMTTVYTLTASNAAGITTNFAAVIVNPCGFANVTNWDATLNFSYTLSPSGGGYSFSVHRQAQATFRLTQFGPGVFAFNGSASGLTSINDLEFDASSGPLTTTTIGAGPPNPTLSAFVLGINCASNTYNFSAIVGVNAIETQTDPTSSSSSPTVSITGQVAIFPRPMPTTTGTIEGSGVLPVVGSFTIPTSDYYTPNGFIANDMWINGVITDATAGTASVSWSLVPVP